MENEMTAVRKTHADCCVPAVAGALFAVRQKTTKILICRSCGRLQLKKNIHRW
jgi:hypothetical protein